MSIGIHGGLLDFFLVGDLHRELVVTGPAATRTVEMESALWMALRGLEEKAALTTDLGRRAGAQGHDLTAARFEEHARETMGAAELVRRLIDDIGTPTRETDVR